MANLPGLRVYSPHEELREQHFNLQRWLYDAIPKKASNRKDFEDRLADGLYGEPRMERLALIEAIKGVLEDRLAQGGQKTSAYGAIDVLNLFFTFVNSGASHDALLTLDTAELHYLEWAEYLFRRAENKSIKYSMNSASNLLGVVGAILSSALEKPEGTERFLYQRTRVAGRRKGTWGGRNAPSKKTDKQNLDTAFLYGEWLYRIASSVDKEAIYGPLPYRIDVDSEFLPMTSIELRFGRPAKKEYTANAIRRLKSTSREPGDQFNPIPFGSELLRNRRAFVNFMILVHAQIFISACETPNPGVVYKLVDQKRKYVNNGDRVILKGFKHRKGGEYYCEFDKRYKADFERYLAFKKHFFPDSDLVFPVFGKDGSVKSISSNMYQLIKQQLEGSSVDFFPPRVMRNTYSNWRTRRSGDGESASEALNHSERTRRQHYEAPNQQKAMTEVTRFWAEEDFLGEKKRSLLASDCDGKPLPVEDIPNNVVQPNCVNPSGCLWCKHHRDIDSFDYVWSLVSFRKLKILEVLISRTKSTESPADQAVERIDQKVKWFRERKESRDWVSESEIRMEEGDYHPNFIEIIEIMES